MGRRKTNQAFTEKQLRFIEERVKDPTQSIADCALAAGYENNPKARGHQLNDNRRIVEEIARRARKLDTILVKEQVVNSTITLITELNKIIHDNKASPNSKVAAIKQLHEIKKLSEGNKDEIIVELESMSDQDVAANIKNLMLSNGPIQDIIKDMITTDRDLATFFMGMILKDEVLLGRLRTTLAIEANAVANTDSRKSA